MASTKRPIVLAFIGSFVWWIFFTLSTLLISPLVVLFSFVSTSMTGYKAATIWARFNIWSLGVLCGLKYQVQGREHIPDLSGFIMMGKHQSTWETLALAFNLPPHIWVFKRELQWLPFFGWALWSVRPIAVNRSSKVSTLEQVVAQATKRMSEGMNVMIFPEGTRVAAGTKGRYKTGGSLLAERTGKPILPVAHNAGHFWPRKGFIKNAGLITIRIGPLIETAGRSAQDINETVETWIEAQQDELDPDAVRQLSDS